MFLVSFTSFDVAYIHIGIWPKARGIKCASINGASVKRADKVPMKDVSQNFLHKFEKFALIFFASCPVSHKSFL